MRITPCRRDGGWQEREMAGESLLTLNTVNTHHGDGKGPQGLDWFHLTTSTHAVPFRRGSSVSHSLNKALKLTGLSVLV